MTPTIKRKKITAILPNDLNSLLLGGSFSEGRLAEAVHTDGTEHHMRA
jgi:hypothetical protein